MSLPKGYITTSIQKDLTKTPFVIFHAHPDDYHKLSTLIERENNKTDTNMFKLFFSKKNIDLIQMKIIAETFRQSKGAYLIEKQDEQDLRVVMRSIYFQHAKHLPINLDSQIKELNNKVVTSIVPDIISQIEGYFGYIERVFGDRYIIDRPKNVSNAGMKTLPSISNTFL